MTSLVEISIEISKIASSAKTKGVLILRPLRSLKSVWESKGVQEIADSKILIKKIKILDIKLACED